MTPDIATFMSTLFFLTLSTLAVSGARTPGGGSLSGHPETFVKRPLYYIIRNCNTINQFLLCCASLAIFWQAWCDPVYSWRFTYHVDVRHQKLLALFAVSQFTCVTYTRTVLLFYLCISRLFKHIACLIKIMYEKNTNVQKCECINSYI